jgi:hypothetical protein
LGGSVIRGHALPPVQASLEYSSFLTPGSNVILKITPCVCRDMGIEHWFL